MSKLSLNTKEHSKEKDTF